MPVRRVSARLPGRYGQLNADNVDGTLVLMSLQNLKEENK